MPSPLGEEIYQMFLREVLPELLEDVPLGIRRRMWFQHDGAPPHFYRNARKFVNNDFPIIYVDRA